MAVSDSVFRGKLHFTQLDKFYISGRDAPERERKRERERERERERGRETETETETERQREW